MTKKRKGKRPRLTRRLPRTVGRPGERAPLAAERIAAVLRERRAAVEAIAAIKFMNVFPDVQDSPEWLDMLKDVKHEQMLWVLEQEKKREQSPHFIAEAPYVRRRYRHSFAQYGGARPYMAPDEHAERDLERMKHFTPKLVRMMGIDPESMPAIVKRKMDRLIAQSSPQEYDRLSDLLLSEVWLLEDVLPLDPPPRPADWSAPTPGSFSHPAVGLLDLGPELEGAAVVPDLLDSISRDPETAREVARIAMDPGLLRGWPGEAASWAPYHALRLLGLAKAVDHAPDLLAIIDVVEDDDWITDQLFLHCLAPMGPPVESLLWQVAHDRARDLVIRGMSMLALGSLAADHGDRKAAIRAEFERILGESLPRWRAGDRKTVNSYAAAVLIQDPFDEDIDWAIVDRADAAGRIDRSIIDPDEIRGIRASS